MPPHGTAGNRVRAGPPALWKHRLRLGRTHLQAPSAAPCTPRYPGARSSDCSDPRALMRAWGGVTWERFGPWKTVLRTASGSGLRTAPGASAATGPGRSRCNGEIDWDISVDSTIVRAHQHAAGARTDPPPALAASTGDETLDIQDETPWQSLVRPSTPSGCAAWPTPSLRSWRRPSAGLLADFFARRTARPHWDFTVNRYPPGLLGSDLPPPASSASGRTPTSASSRSRTGRGGLQVHDDEHGWRKRLTSPARSPSTSVT